MSTNTKSERHVQQGSSFRDSEPARYLKYPDPEYLAWLDAFWRQGWRESDERLRLTGTRSLRRS